MEPDSLVDTLWDNVREQLNNPHFSASFSSAITFSTNPVMGDLFANQVVDNLYSRLLQDAPSSDRVEVGTLTAFSSHLHSLTLSLVRRQCRLSLALMKTSRQLYRLRQERKTISVCLHCTGRRDHSGLQRIVQCSCWCNQHSACI